MSFNIYKTILSNILRNPEYVSIGLIQTAFLLFFVDAYFRFVDVLSLFILDIGTSTIYNITLYDPILPYITCCCILPANVLKLVIRSSNEKFSSWK